jgi:hypothetical protein
MASANLAGEKKKSVSSEPFLRDEPLGPSRQDCRSDLHAKAEMRGDDEKGRRNPSRLRFDVELPGRDAVAGRGDSAEGEPAQLIQAAS